MRAVFSSEDAEFMLDIDKLDIVHSVDLFGCLDIFLPGILVYLKYDFSRVVVTRYIVYIDRDYPGLDGGFKQIIHRSRKVRGKGSYAALSGRKCRYINDLDCFFHLYT